MTMANSQPPASRAGLCPSEHFPGVASTTYLNAAGIGLTPLPVAQSTADYVMDLAVRGTVAYFETIEKLGERSKLEGSKLFGCDPQNIALTDSTAEAICQFAWWVAPKRGQNVVVIDIDHPSPIYPWLRIAEDTGAEIRYVRVEQEPQSLTPERLAALTDRNTVAISVSHVLWTSGYRFDLRALADLAHSVGAYLVVDATQSAGVIPLDVVAMNVDFLAASAFKWMLSHSGVALCYIRPEIAERMRPLLVGNNSTGRTLSLRPAGYDTSRIAYPDGVARLQYASSCHVARHTLGGALEYLNRIGIGNIERHVLKLCKQLGEGLSRLGAEVLTPEPDNARAGIVTARFPNWSGESLSERLAQHQVVTLPRLNGVRFAPHLYNDSADIARALEVVEALAPGSAS
jgi:cysteine desulfurase / selenocysteine lyase